MSIPQTFQAVLLDTAGAPVAVRDRQPERSTLEPNEVGIKITATAINPVDWKLRDYPKMLFKTMPAVLGSDAAGVISAKGSSVSGFEVGDRVFFQGYLGKYDTGSFQEYARSDAAVVGKTPDNISDEQAAGISLAGITAAIGLYHSVGRALPAPWDTNGRSAGNGKAIVVLGGSSSVGQYAVQFARLSGYSRIVTNGSAANADLLKKLGAHVILDRKTQNSATDFLGAIGGAEVPVDLVYDAIGSTETQTLAVQVLKQAQSVDSGLVVCTNRGDSQAVELGNNEDGGKRKVEIKGILAVGPAPEMRYVSEPFYKHLPAWLASGEFVPNKPVIVEGGLNSIEEALQKQKAGVSGAKVVVKV